MEYFDGPPISVDVKKELVIKKTITENQIQETNENEKDEINSKESLNDNEKGANENKKEEGAFKRFEALKGKTPTTKSLITYHSSAIIFYLSDELNRGDSSIGVKNRLDYEVPLNNHLFDKLSGYLDVNKTLEETILKGSEGVWNKSKDWDYLPESFLTTEYVNSEVGDLTKLKKVGELIGANDKYIKIVDKNDKVIGYAFTKNATITDFIKGLEHFQKEHFGEEYKKGYKDYPYKHDVNKQGKINAEILAKDIRNTSEAARIFVLRSERITE